MTLNGYNAYTINGKQKFAVVQRWARVSFTNLLSVLHAGVCVCMIPIVLVDLFGQEKLSNAFGFSTLFGGIGALSGPPFAGRFMTMTI